jgi:hypothetical protein
MKMIVYSILFVLFLFFLASADTLNVKSQYATIQSAIDAATDGDVVLVENGLYYENINFKGKKITVASHYLKDQNESHIENTIIDGSQHTNPDSGSVVYFVSGEDTNSVLCGFTITGGTGTKGEWSDKSCWSGAGIFCASGGKIIHNIVKNNAMDVDVVYAWGGGIIAGWYAVEYVHIEDNTIEANTVKNTGDVYGAGIAFYCNGKMRNNVIINNNLEAHQNMPSPYGGGSGAGIHCEGYDPIFISAYIQNNKIINNKILLTGSGDIRAVAAGLRVSVWNGEISGNLIKNNYSTSAYIAFGGGLFIWGSNKAIVTNNIISSNTVEASQSAYGGGIYMGSDLNGNYNLINNTIVNNNAGHRGGGIDAFYTTCGIVLNSIIWGNDAPTSSQVYRSSTSSLQLQYCDIEDVLSGVGNINMDPLFADTLFRLSDSSPCIGSGIESIQIGDTWYSCPNSCYFGGPRPNPFGTPPDIGACESTVGPSFTVKSCLIKSTYINPNADSLLVKSNITNYLGHDLQVRAVIKNVDESWLDSTQIYDDGNHGDGQAGDNLWANYYSFTQEDMYIVKVKAEDVTTGETRWDPYTTHMTTIGPVVFDHFEFSSTDTVPNAGDRIRIDIILKNSGSVATATNIEAILISLDTLVDVTGNRRGYDDIAPEEMIESDHFYSFNISDEHPGSIEIPFRIEIMSDGFVYWTDEFSIPGVTDISDRKEKIPTDFTLYQNYPNPFNPKTVISYALPVTCHAELSIYNILGQKVATLVNNKLPAGSYEVEFNGQNFSSGVYLYRIQSGEWQDVKKMLLLK